MDTQNTDISEQDQQELLELRGEDTPSCEPPTGDGCESFTESSQYGSVLLPCNFDVEMKITVCAETDGTLTYNFEEVSITPTDPNCVFDQDDLDTAYSGFVSQYMKTDAEVVSCGFDLTTESNYFKASCMEVCISNSISIYGTYPVVYISCSEDASGCCIETSEWCEPPGQNQVPVEISILTETVPGVCTGSSINGCEIQGFRGGCIVERCTD